MIQTEIEELCHKEIFLEVCIQPFVEEALQLSQMMDNTFNTIQQTQCNIEIATKGRTTEKLVQQAQGAAAQSLKLVLPLKSSVSALQSKIKEKAPQLLEMSHMFMLGAYWIRVPLGTLFDEIFYKSGIHVMCK